MLPDLISTYNQSNKAITKVTSVRTIAEMLIVVANSKSFFWEICKLVRIYFTIPIFTATAERSFSMLRWLAKNIPSLKHVSVVTQSCYATECSQRQN